MWTMQPRSTDAKDASLKRQPKGSSFLLAKCRFFTRRKARRTKSLKWVVIAAPVAAVTISGLWNHVAAAQAKTPPLAFLYAKDLTNNSLLAVTGQTIVFESSSADSVARVELQEGRHRLCLTWSDEYFTGLELDDSVPMLDSQGCTMVNGRSEFYRVRLSHAAAEPTVAEVALLSIDPKRVPLATSNGELRKGFWALTPLIETRGIEATRGRLRAVPSTSVGRMPVIADLSSRQMDSYSLWQFGKSSPVLLADPKSTFSFDPNALWDSAKRTIFVGQEGEAAILRPRGNSDRFQLRLENDEAAPRELAFAPTLFGPQTLTAVPSLRRYLTPATFSLAFRFFSDGTDLDPLTEGEIALFQSPDYQGRVAVFPTNTRSLAALSSSATTLDHQAFSIRVGPGTEATLYSGENYSGTVTRIYGDTPALLEIGNTASIRLAPLVIRLLANRSCLDCNFDGVDLSGLDLTGVDLRGARLIGTNLTDTRFDGAKLENANLSGATLSCTGFAGTDADHRNDLTSTDFSNIQLVHSSSCRSDFSYTIITAGLLSPQMLPDVQLTGAIIRSPGRSLRSTPILPPNLTSGFTNFEGLTIPIPKGGYWAIQPDPAQDPQQRSGRLRLQLPFRNYGAGGSLNIAPIAVDYSSQQMDRLSLFQIINYQHLQTDAILGPPAKTFFDWTPGEGSVLGIGSNYDPISNIAFPIDVMDLGGYRFTFGESILGGPKFLPLYKTSDGFLTRYAGDPPNLNLKLRVMFRYYPDGTQIGPLQPGEVALFEQANYIGKAAVFAPGADPVDLTAMNSSETTIDNSAQSILVGNDTALIWTSPVAKKAVALLSMATTGDHRLNEWGPPTGQISTIAATDVFKGDHYPFDCSGCQMIGVNLSGTAKAPLQLTNKYLYGANFSQATFSYVDLSLDTLSAVHFDGATLSNVSFLNTQLQGTSFEGAKLSCADFHGADSNHLVDLTQASFTNATWLTARNCLNNLSYTKLLVTQFPPSAWHTSNLTGAVFVDAAGKQLSSMNQPLTLNNAKMAGVSLQGAILDYAVMNNADLTGAFLSNTSWVGANLENAKLYAATLVNANFDGANLGFAYLTKLSSDGKAANLEGAFLRNVNLSNSKLSGAKFTNASFYSTIPAGISTCVVSNGFTDSCATAAGAIMEDTDFGGGYLYGVDFTESTVQGTHFGNSFLTGANFAGAQLSSDRSGTEVGFSSAFLQGTNFTGATLKNGVSMADAFVDFGTGGSGGFGNAIYLKLSGAHTGFPGYWGAPGDPVCVEMSYSNATGVPPTGPNDTCPDGNSYPKGCGPATPDGSNAHWKSPIDITSMASYQENATYTKAPSNGQPFCAQDPNWKPF